MTTIVAGRHTHRHDGAAVVFLLGIRINRLRAVRAWLPAISAMPDMLRELSGEPALGMLGFTRHLSARGALVVQYWRDLETLIEYAHSTGQAHRPAWTEFNRRARHSGGAVGIWHETFVVTTGGHESVYVDMPTIGMAAAYGAVPATGRRQSARGRLATEA